MRRCVACGCTEDHACVNEAGERCAWVGPNLCSFCDRMGDEQEHSALVLPGDPEYSETMEALRG